MTTWGGRLTFTTVAGSLIVLLPGERPVTAAPPGQVKEVKVGITRQGRGCDHHVSLPSARLKKDQDALGWRIKNTCHVDQDVLLCVYRDDQLNNPFHPCQNDPASRDIGKVFNVASKVTVKLDCPAKDPGRYQKVILVGREVPNGGCPDRIPPTEPRVHRLPIEIVP